MTIYGVASSSGSYHSLLGECLALYIFHSLLKNPLYIWIYLTMEAKTTHGSGSPSGISWPIWGCLLGSHYQCMYIVQQTIGYSYHRQWGPPLNHTMSGVLKSTFEEGDWLSMSVWVILFNFERGLLIFCSWTDSKQYACKEMNRFDFGQETKSLSTDKYLISQISHIVAEFFTRWYNFNDLTSLTFSSQTIPILTYTWIFKLHCLLSFKFDFFCFNKHRCEGHSNHWTPLPVINW